MFADLGWYGAGWWKNVDESDPQSCTLDEMEQAVEGYFSNEALSLSVSKYPGISGIVGLTTITISLMYDSHHVIVKKSYLYLCHFPGYAIVGLNFLSCLLFFLDDVLFTS